VSKNLLDAEAGGGFEEIDLQFAALLSSLEGRDCVELYQAAALASQATREGNICLDLRLVAAKSATGDLAGQSSALPFDFSTWPGKLRECATVGEPGEYKPLILDNNLRLYLYRYWEYENNLAENIRQRARDYDRPIDLKKLRHGLARLFPADDADSPDWQKVAAFTAAHKKLCVISGGPGTGKTAAIAKILALLLEQEASLQIVLAAPTGKAAIRLQESIQREKSIMNCAENIKDLIPEQASTVHRLLKSLPRSPYFKYNKDNKLPADVVVVDEASMVDLPLMAKLTAAIDDSARLILLGDKDQLASVEAGAVLADICGETVGYSGDFQKSYGEVTGKACRFTLTDTEPGLSDCVVELRRSYRFGPDSGIEALSRRIKTGDSPGVLSILQAHEFADVDWQPLPSGVERLMGEIIKREYAGLENAGKPEAVFNSLERFRVLGAVNDGPYGVAYLNQLIQRGLNAGRSIGQGRRWQPGQPIMITRNDYGLGLFNGDIGVISPDSGYAEFASAVFRAEQGGLRTVPAFRLPDHETAYAITIHKSQGSEFDSVLIILPDRDNPILTRELLYTAVTRAKNKVMIRGNPDIIGAAVDRRTLRTAGLRDALKV